MCLEGNGDALLLEQMELRLAANSAVESTEWMLPEQAIIAWSFNSDSYRWLAYATSTIAEDANSGRFMRSTSFDVGDTCKKSVTRSLTIASRVLDVSSQKSGTKRNGPWFVFPHEAWNATTETSRWLT